MKTTELKTEKLAAVLEAERLMALPARLETGGCSRCGGGGITASVKVDVRVSLSGGHNCG